MSLTLDLELAVNFSLEIYKDIYQQADEYFNSYYNEELFSKKEELKDLQKSMNFMNSEKKEHIENIEDCQKFSDKLIEINKIKEIEKSMKKTEEQFEIKYKSFIYSIADSKVPSKYVFKLIDDLKLNNIEFFGIKAVQKAFCEGAQQFKKGIQGYEKNMMNDRFQPKQGHLKVTAFFYQSAANAMIDKNYC